MTDIHPKRNNQKTQDILWTDFKNLLPKGHPLIGIDYGSVRIGIALSDKDRQMARPFKIIAKLIELDDIVRSKEVCGFVIGMPYQPDGTEGETAEAVRQFANRLTQKYNLPIYFVDERLSSSRAEKALIDIGMRSKKIKKVLDANVARDLLQSVLNQG